MLTITVQVSAPLGQALEVKEALALYLECWGQARVVSVEETAPEQMMMDLR